MRLATWNVNSVKQRVPRLLPWLDERKPDVVCLQETKLSDEAFMELLGDELDKRDYEVAVHGQAAWNGVAILSRVGLDDVVAGLAGALAAPVRSLTPGMGFSVLIESFIVTVIGGMGSILGALVGALLIGLIRSFGSMGFPLFTEGLMYLFMVIVLVSRPSGLFGKEVA